jgi:hypothetical protein
MFEAKKSIPAVATASLVLGGGCDDGPSVGSVASDTCRGLLRCDPDYFAELFVSRAECQDYYEEYFQYYVDYYFAEFGPACADAALEYDACYFSTYDNTCSADTALERCAPFRRDFDRECR